MTPAQAAREFLHGAAIWPKLSGFIAVAALVTASAGCGCHDAQTYAKQGLYAYDPNQIASTLSRGTCADPSYFAVWSSPDGTRVFGQCISRDEPVPHPGPLYSIAEGEAGVSIRDVASPYAWFDGGGNLVAWAGDRQTIHFAHSDLTVPYQRTEFDEWGRVFITGEYPHRSVRATADPSQVLFEPDERDQGIWIFSRGDDEVILQVFDYQKHPVTCPCAIYRRTASGFSVVERVELPGIIWCVDDRSDWAIVEIEHDAPFGPEFELVNLRTLETKKMGTPRCTYLFLTSDWLRQKLH